MRTWMLQEIPSIHHRESTNPVLHEYTQQTIIHPDNQKECINLFRTIY